MKNPGRAGLTVDRLGDSATWRPDAQAGKDARERMPSYSLTDIPSIMRK